MRSGRAIFLGGIFLAVLLAGLAGCRRGQDTTVADATRKGILLVGNGPEIESLDPLFTSGTSALAVQQALYEGLVTPDPRTLDPIPGVAMAWDVSDDGLHYTFHLRPDALWSDGEEVTADDFVFAWKRMREAPVRGSIATLHDVIADFSAPKRHELDVTLRHPAPYFVGMLEHPAFYPVPQHVVEREGDPNGRENRWAQPGTFVGNGPFVLAKWLPEQVLEVTRNERYWDREAVGLNGIRFFPLADANTEERAFRGGQLHVTETLPPGRVQRYREDHSPFLRVDPYLGVYYLILNHRHPLLDSVAERRTLSEAIDREVICARLLGAGQEPATSFTPPGFLRYEAPLAAAMADEEKQTTTASFAGKLAVYVYNTSDTHRLIAEALGEMWREKTGLNLQLENVEFRTYLDRRETGDFDLMRASWIGDYVDPLAFLEIWRSGAAASDFSGWQDPAFDALLDEASGLRDPAKRAATLAQAEAILLRQQVMIPLYHYVTAYLLRPEVTGWDPTLLDWHPWKFVGLDSAVEPAS